MNHDWMIRPWMRGKLFYGALFIALSTLFVGVDTAFNYHSINNFIANEEREAQADFDRHERSLQEISDLIYATAINTEEVLSLYRGTLGADEGEKARIRSELWDLLRDRYGIFHTFRIQQLHFQLPDNESFLRFHKPEKFGDNLTGVRPTIEYVNRTHKRVSGFEEGRIFNGFRYVYPLIDRDGTYLGSVEVSSSALSYKEAFEMDEKQEMDIVLRADVVEGKVFESEQGNYIPYPMNPAFRIEKAMVVYDRGKSHEHDHQTSLESLAGSSGIPAKMERMERFTVFDMHDGKFDLITFLPISNAITKEKVAYAVIFRESEYLYKALKGYLFEVVLATAAALVLTIIFYVVQMTQLTRKELEKALLVAEEANRAKDTFLSSMSHELRTPLNAIIGFSQILMHKSDTPPSIRGIIEKIHISGKNLLALVNTILDFSKIEAGKMEIAIAPFDLAGMVSEIQILVEPMAEKKKISLSLEVPEGTIVHADAQQLKQVLVNLLGNAVKFSPEASRITLTYRDEGEHRLAVCDQGIGIPPEKIATLFDPFTQIREHQDGATKGTGLGLSIVKRIAELHGGTIHVESAVGKGSCFILSFPKTL